MIKFVAIFLIWVIALVLTLAVVKGKGKPITLLDKNGNPYPEGISTRESVVIGGAKQSFFIASENKNNPVLLFLHGGPGSPEVGMHSFQPSQRLEERFTVCYWEQRGAGLSYGARLKPDEMTMELMVSDTIELTEYLMQRFDKQQIYLMGHSWGTLLGAAVLQEKPEYFKAYFGVAQVTNQLLSEQQAYHYMLQYAKEIGDTKAVQALEKFDPSAEDFPSSPYMMSARTAYMNKYGVGLVHEENFKMSAMIKQILFFEGYSLADFAKFGMGSMFSSKEMFHLVADQNLMVSSTHFDVPIYIFHGLHDKQVSYDLSYEYYNLISAPDKNFYTFENSAHSPNFEEHERFLEIVFSLLDENE